MVISMRLDVITYLESLGVTTTKNERKSHTQILLLDDDIFEKAFNRTPSKKRRGVAALVSDKFEKKEDVMNALRQNELAIGRSGYIVAKHSSLISGGNPTYRVTPIGIVKLAPKPHASTTGLDMTSMANLEKTGKELYVDFETCYMEGRHHLTMIGVGGLVSEVRDLVPTPVERIRLESDISSRHEVIDVYPRVVVEINKEDEWGIITVWARRLSDECEAGLVETFKDILSKAKDARLYHWAWAEPSLLKNAMAKNKSLAGVTNVMRNTTWFDLYKEFKSNATVEGASSYGLKDIARNMHRLGMVPSTWPKSGPQSGGEVAKALLSIYNGSDRVNVSADDSRMGEVVAYNEIDCKVMYEMVKYVRGDLDPGRTSPKGEGRGELSSRDEGENM